jgi:hypothetical protein
MAKVEPESARSASGFWAPQGGAAWLIKGITSLIAIAGVVISVWKVLQSVDEQAAAAAERSRTEYRQAQKDYYDRQLGLYFEVVDVTGLLATEPDPAVRAPALRRFWQLYWGPLCLVEDAQEHPTGTGGAASTVEAAMIHFGDQLRQLPAQPSAQDLEPLQPLAYELAHTIRGSLRGVWPIPPDSPGFVSRRRQRW